MDRRLVTMALVAGALLAGAPAASGTVVHLENYSGTDAFSESDCGFTLDHAVTFSGQLRIRSVDGEAFLAKDTYRYHEVITNPDTGGWFVLRGHGLFSEIDATHVSGTLYRFEAIDAGQPFIIEDSAGNVIVRDRGAIQHAALFDTLGDGEPSADFIEDLGSVVHGPHEGFGEDFPFCDIAAELTGAS